MIDKIALSRFHNPELLNFMLDESKDARSLGISSLTPMLDEIDKALVLLDKAIVKVVGSEYAAQMRSVEAMRTMIYRKILGVIKGETYRFEAERVSAAGKLNRLIKAYGRIDMKSLRNKNELMDNFVRDLRSETYKANVATLQLGLLVDKLHEANVEFDRLFDLRDAEQAKRVRINTSQVRQVIYYNYRKLVQMISAMLMLQPEEKTQAFAKRHNERATKMKVLFAYRTSISNSGRERAKREINKMLAPLIKDYTDKHHPGKDLEFEGQTYGTGTSRIYLIRDKEDQIAPFWVMVKEDVLVKTKKPNPRPTSGPKPTGEGELPNIPTGPTPDPNTGGSDPGDTPPNTGI